MNDPNLPSGLTRRDLDHIEGRHYDDVEGITDADRDELRGQDWIRAVAAELPEHAAIPVAVNKQGTAFQALCRCGYVSDVYRASGFAKAHVIVDANSHNKLNREPA